MPDIILRSNQGKSSPTDLTVSVQDRTFEYLQTTITPEIRVSAFLEVDVARVEAEYAEIYLGENSPFESRITKVIPGSRTRKGIELPGAMSTGEQLTLLVNRVRKNERNV
jgi:hypothetical protein